MTVHVGERFSRRIELTRAEVGEIARATGDLNPLHHDPEYARRTKYRGPIASGPHTSGLLMGFTATHLLRHGPMVGLEFNFRFRAPVPADDRITLEWLVTRVTPSARLGGTIVDLQGRLVTSDGRTAVAAAGRVLMTAEAGATD